MAITALAAGLAVRLRHALPATAESLATVALVLLGIDLIAAPGLGLFPHRLLDAGELVRARCVRARRSRRGLRRLALSPPGMGHPRLACGCPSCAGFLASAIAHLADDPAAWSGYGVLAAVAVGIGLMAGGGTPSRPGPLSRLAPDAPWPSLAGLLILIGSAAASPMAVLADGARASWIVATAGPRSCWPRLASRAAGVTRQAIADSAGATAGVALALILLPEPATSLALAVCVGVIGAAVVVVGAVTQREDLAVLAAGSLWAGWVGGLLLRTGNDINGRTQIQVSIVLGTAAAVLVAYSVLGGRPEYAWLGAASAVLGLTAALPAADVRGVEWFTLPAAGILLVAGLAWRHNKPTAHSAIWLGPAAATAALPSAIACWAAPWITDNGGPATEHIVRLVLVLGLSGLAAIAGARLRLAGLFWPAAAALVIAGTAELWGAPMSSRAGWCWRSSVRRCCSPAPASSGCVTGGRGSIVGPTGSPDRQDAAPPCRSVVHVTAATTTPSMDGTPAAADPSEPAESLGAPGSRRAGRSGAQPSPSSRTPSGGSLRSPWPSWRWRYEVSRGVPLPSSESRSGWGRWCCCSTGSASTSDRCRAAVLAVFEALYFAPLAIGLAFTLRLPVPLAVVGGAGVWVAEEAVRTRWPYGGFGWGRLGFSQADAPTLHLASVGGAPLISYVVAVMGLLLAQAAYLVGRRGRWPALLSAAIGVALAFGAVLIPAPTVAGRTVTVALDPGQRAPDRPGHREPASAGAAVPRRGDQAPCRGRRERQGGQAGAGHLAGERQ